MGGGGNDNWRQFRLKAFLRSGGEGHKKKPIDEVHNDWPTCFFLFIKIVFFLFSSSKQFERIPAIYFSFFSLSLVEN